MRGLVPRIHVFFRAKEHVDGRDKHGHDDKGVKALSAGSLALCRNTNRTAAEQVRP